MGSLQLTCLLLVIKPTVYTWAPWLTCLLLVIKPTVYMPDSPAVYPPHFYLDNSALSQRTSIFRDIT